MPRQSPFQIELGEQERAELEARARQYTLPYRDVVRAKIILLAADGLENKEIAARLDLARPKVSGESASSTNAALVHGSRFGFMIMPSD